MADLTKGTVVEMKRRLTALVDENERISQSISTTRKGSPA